MQRCSDVIAMIVGTVLLFAASSKIIAPDTTLKSLAWAFGSPASGFIGMMLVIAEFLLGVALIFGIQQKICLSLASLLFFAFSLWIVYLNVVDAPVGCGCGINWITGASQSVQTGPDVTEVVRAVFFSGLSAAGVFSYRLCAKRSARVEKTERSAS